MAKAFILINIASGAEESVLKDIIKIQSTVKADFIYGKYDCIIIMESDKTDSLKTDIFLLRKTPNITSTLTMMVID